jgi:hypothetical protein
MCPQESDVSVFFGQVQAYPPIFLEPVQGDQQQRRHTQHAVIRKKLW